MASRDAVLLGMEPSVQSISCDFEIFLDRSVSLSQSEGFLNAS